MPQIMTSVFLTPAWSLTPIAVSVFCLSWTQAPIDLAITTYMETEKRDRDPVEKHARGESRIVQEEKMQLSFSGEV